MASKLVALDTNVLIYLHDSSSPRKRSIAENLLANSPGIPSQVISEYLNTTRRLLDLSKEDLLIQTSSLLSGCPIISVLPRTIALAATLVKQHKFQLFDSITVAAAIEGLCDILYSEDMHHGLIFNNTLTIINPFI